MLGPDGWRAAATVPALPQGEVHVWLAPLDLPPRVLGNLAAVLAPDERAKAARYRFMQDRNRAIARRGVLRTVLAAYVGTTPGNVRFGHNAQGKPHLAIASGAGWQFNLSDSHGLTLLAVTRNRRLGVDLERVDGARSTWDVAEQFFAPAEVQALREIPESLQAEAFFRCWTRKEAYVKARGEGLSLPLDQFQVSVAPEAPPALLWTALGWGETSRWTLADLPPLAGYAAALCVEGRDPRVRCWRWTYPAEGTGRIGQDEDAVLEAHAGRPGRAPGPRRRAS